jgi:hypothetical protein
MRGDGPCIGTLAKVDKANDYPCTRARAPSTRLVVLSLGHLGQHLGVPYGDWVGIDFDSSVCNPGAAEMDGQQQTAAP